jgi:hypothetical protein
LPGVTYNTTSLAGGPVVSGQLNAEGTLDLVMGSGPPAGADVFWGNGDGTFQPAQFFASEQTGLPAIGDLNGDHLPDILFANALWVTTMLNTGIVHFSPSSPITFPTQLINSISASQRVTLTNLGAAPVFISSVSATGDFILGSGTTCAKSIAPRAICIVEVAFDPLTTGLKGGRVTIVDTASSKPQVIDLSGQATVISVVPTSLSFGAQKAGTRSAPMTATVKNNGSQAVNVSAVTIYGYEHEDFSDVTNCTAGRLAGGASCTIQVTFDPTKKGTRSATVLIEDNGGGSPQKVSLAGTGK